MGKLIENVIKNRVVVVTAAMFAVVMSFIMSNRMIKNDNNVATITDPETLRAMSYEEITAEDEVVGGIDTLKFSAFFLRDIDGDGIANKLKGTCNDVSEKPDTLYINFNLLGDGKLKNAKITLYQSNFNWNSEIVQDNIVASSYSGNVTTITLKNELIGGSQKLFSGSIYPYIRDNINNYTGVNRVVLTGTYVDDEGIETPIEKSIDLTVDWYGTTKTIVNKNNLLQTKEMKTLIENDTVKVKFEAVVTETEEELILQKQVAELKIPDLNGYAATNAYTTTSRANSQFDSENKTLTITNNANVKQNGDVQVAIARGNTYEVVVEYPLEAYEAANGGNISLDFPIKGYNYGYNNPNTEFSNPYVSSDSNTITVVYTADADPGEGGQTIIPTGNTSEYSVGISVGDFVYSKTIGSEYRISQDTILERYSGSLYEDVEDTYTVRWYAYIFDSNKISKITLEEETVSENRRTDDFTKLNLEKTSMRDYETTVGISFENASKILGSNGYIKLYNAETDTLIETFTRANWNSTYRVGLDDLKSIKIETSSPIANGALGVHQTKKIDDSKVIEDFTKEEFQSFRYIYSYVKGTAYSAGANLANGDTTWTRYSQERAKYEGSLSIQNISVQPQEISNQDTRNVNIIINTSATNDFESGWIDGVFLVELPEDFLEVAVNSVTVNNNNVKISNWSYFEENGKKYIKIYTSNSNEETYNITINAAITANPLAATKPETIGLYAYNKNCNNYYYNALDQYDLDEDLSAQDLIGYSTTTLTTVAPSGLLTTEYITNYDEYSSVTIAPNIAEIEKTDGSRTATVNIRLIDNYTGTISDVCILGRIPYEGNRYILVDRDLKSEYTAHITGPISIPTNQVNNVTIYYSANGNANNDKDGTNNGWMLAEDVTDWTTIKSYLIDFGDYVFTEASEDTFSYEVEIPAGVGYDSATYSNHAVYYSLETPNGKLEMETEPNRVGMQVVGKYTLNLTKNKVGKTGTFVPGATYRVVAKDANDNLISKIAVTDENGNLTFNDMYIGREYTLEEIASPSDYSLTEGIIVFNTSVNDQGQLIVDVIHDIEHGITRDFNETPTVTLDNNGNYVVNAKVEDEAKYTITINKSDEEGNPLASTIFKFGTDERTKNYITDSNGQIVITGLELDKEYIIQETRSDGYYVDEEEKSFKITRDENGLKIVTEDPILANAVIDSPNNKAQTQVTIDIENEKIPTYKLRITKVNKTKDGEAETTLEGAYFRIASADTQKQEEYKTDENGIIEIDGLYLHVDGKYVSGRYEIQETKAPGGYLNSSDLIAIEVNGVYNDQTQKYDLDISVENEDQLESVKSITVESDTVKIVVQDKPLFQLTKVDSDTGEILANVEFIVYKMEKDGTTDYAKDEYGNYIGIPNDQGEYIVTTDENGVISLPLPDGKYCLVEVTYPEGYQVKEEAEYFIIGDDDGEEVEDEDKKVIEINYIEDLVELSEKTNNGYSYKNAIIKLMRDLDFNDPGSYRSGEIDWNLVETENSQGFTPIGKQNCNFTGIFDGQGHTISNLYVNCDEAYIGLFGRISDSEIKNLNVNGIVGCESLTSSTLSDVYAGGITGYSSNSKISNCCCNIEFDIPTNSASYVGGIVGLVENGEVCDCYNDTGFEISKTSKSYYAYTFTGGIIGKASNSIIKRCYNNGNISGSNNGGGATSSQKPRVYTHTGGIAGDISNTDVLNCYNTGDIYSYAYTNGYIEGTAYHDYWVKVGEAYSGGIVGYVDNGNIEDSYNVGNITRSGISSSGNYGIAGYLSNGERINCYNLSGKGTSDETGVTQYTDEYMKSSNFVQDLGSESWSKVANQNSDYPILEDNTEDITVINYIDDLVDLAIDVNNGNSYEGKTIKLMRDLDFNDASSYKNNQVDTSLTSSGTGFNIIGISKKTPFSGIFDGQGHTISNLYIKTDKDYVGLFGYISEAEIKNLSITGSVEEYLVISTNAYDDLQETKYVGGFVGFSSYSGIDNCSNACVVTGRVSLTNTKGSSASTGSAASSQVNIGSIVGNATYSRISNCYNTNNVNGRSTSNCKNTSSQNYCSSYSTVLIGGIVGHINESNVVNCYNRGNVESSASAGSSNYVYKDANARAGGICGTESSSVISNVYNTGNVSASASENSSGGIVATNGSATTVTNAYYLDTITIQGTVIQRGETRTESQMKNADFVDELGDRYWSLNESENDGYPVLNNEVELITEINYIEDLVQLSNDVNNGKSYKDHVVTLMRDLDFNDPSSYRSGVVNQDLISGENNGGFIPIGCDSGSAFSGTFEGQGYEIRNIYVNSGKTYAGLFGRLDGAKVRDLGLTGEIAGNSKYAGGIAGEILNGAVIMNCYNTAKISGKIYVGGIAGDSKDSIIKYTNNSGTIEGVNNVGGIVGRLSNSKAEYSYNTGNINGNDAVGGIAGYVENESLIIDTYNTGKAKAKKYAGGIAGYTSAGDILNSYNVGSVKATDNSGSYGYAGAIIGYKTNISSSNMAAHNSYYVDSVVIDGRIINNKGTGITDDYMKSKEFYSELNVDGVWMYRKDKYPILINKQIKNVLGDSTELTINNTIKKFIITTDIKEIDGVKGGTITGEDEKPYETVDYAESSTKAISIVPDEGYVINSITINDEDFVFVPESDGTYTFAAGYFSNMDEDKNIVVSFSPKDKTIYISKVDKEGNPLGGAEFSIESNNDTPELGTLTNNNANYYFVENEGVYVSNNNGVNSSCANSYIKLDLTNYHGKYNVVVNAQVSSQSGGDYGYVTITKTTTAPAYNSTTGRLIYISGTVSARDYSTELEAGDIYYIHLGYNKNASTNTGNDCFTVNSVNVVPVVETYTAVTNEGGIAILPVTYLGKYKIKETKAPEHYIIDDTEKEIELVSGASVQTVEFENKRKTEIVVHHYLEGTTNKVAEDDVLWGEPGESFEARPHTDLEKLSVVENQEYYAGTFGDEGAEYIIYYKAAKVKLTIHHYYEGTEKSLVEDKVIYQDSQVIFTGEAEYQVVTDASYVLNTNEDYTVLKEDNEFVGVTVKNRDALTIEDTLEYNTDTEITYYYKLKEVNYKVQYFYNNVLDEDKTEYCTEVCDVTIESYIDKCTEGYKFDYVKALDENGDETEMPLTLRANEEYNVINVYYITDDTQQKDIGYIVEYYKDGVRVEEDTQIKTGKVQVLENTMEVDKDDINIVDKYLGYKFDSSNPAPIPDTIENGGIIKVYYVFDEDATKELKYTVEYYLDSVKVEADTQEEKIIVHVLQPDTLTVDKTKINTVDKYEGSICTSTNPSTIPDIVNTGSVIKVYYMNVVDYKFGKIWNGKTEEEVNKHRTTYTLYKNINGSESTVTNSNRKIVAVVNDATSTDKEVTYSSTSTTVTITVIGNGTVEFKNLPRYSNGNEITYLVKETRIERTTNNGTSWSTQSLNNYRINYNDEYEGLDRRVENTETFKITTEIAPNGANERVGGTITGEFTSAYPESSGKRYVETVNESETPVNDIVIDPDEGYIITGITINGSSYSYTPDANGNVTIAKEYFQNIKENKHIVVSFIDTTKLIKIIKEDEYGNRLAGAEFSISNKNDYSSHIGAITADPDYDYYFEEMSDGSFASNNVGVDGSTAGSYSDIDLSDLTGTFNLRVNASISSESGYDYGYIEVEDIETGSVETLVSNSGSERNIIREVTLQGGKEYKIYYRYSKDESSGSGDDRFYINSVKIETGDEYTATTNENGEALVEVYSDSAYNVKETKAPAGYIKSDEIKSVTAPNEVSFVNSADTYVITTEVGINSLGERSGGTITGEYTEGYLAENNIKFVESVRGTQNATMDIEITPTSGYEVSRITINGENYTFEADSNGNVVIPRSEFTNVTSDKHIVVKFEEEEKTVTIIKTNKRSGQPLQGAKFRLTSNFERGTNVDSYISDMYGDPVYNQYSFDYSQSTGTYTSNNQHEDGTMAIGYKIVDLTTLTGEYTFVVNAEVSSEESYDSARVIIDDISPETAQADINYDNLQNSYEMFYASGESSSQDYTTTLYGGKKYAIYFIYSKDGSEYSGEDTFTINSIGFENSSAPIVVETDLTDAEGKATFNIRGYGEYTVSEIVTPDGFITMDDMTFELLPSEDNQIINIENERESVIYSTYTVNYYEKNTTTPLETSKTSGEVEVDSQIMATDEVINIDGYEFDSADVDSIFISEDSEENVINLYYTKRNDLSYTVNYLEKGTDHVLHTSKTEPNQTFGDEITSVNEKITIDGYNYDSVDPEVLTIGASSENNVINVYYTKRNNLSYTVHYREQGVDGDAGKLADDKVEGNQVFGDKVTENAIDIPGFEKVEPTSAEIEITTGTNEHTFYYTRITGLSYTVNYL
ncbi:MAG: hypothetical protein IKE91_08205, partial [Clostridia bacterium]|nr:hypothetical protein [Clostridia bacterium]